MCDVLYDINTTIKQLAYVGKVSGNVTAQFGISSR